MLTRIRLQGFKSFEDTEVRFGPFTCIAGANGVGKSNLFDAIQFLRDLTEFPIDVAASHVRDPAGKTGDIRTIFTQSKDALPDVRIEADFIVPSRVYDDFNREALPAATFLRYKLELRYVAAQGKAAERIELLEESLTHIQKGQAKDELGFPTTPAFRKSAIENKRRGVGFISTTNENGNTTIKLHQEGGLGGGRPFLVPAANSNKTIVGGITTNDYPTVLAARREMQSWILLQLEPSSLRQPDAFSADSHLTSNGAHMAATLLRLGAETDVSNRLANLLDDVGSVFVEKDESRRTYTLNVSGRDGVGHSARSLSDGTLRFLALAILAADPESGRLMCLEEPENGIHPSRIPAILELLRDMAANTRKAVNDSLRAGNQLVEKTRVAEFDTADKTAGQLELPMENEDPADIGQTLGGDNPLRQVIINTHSPVVVSSLDINDLLMARLVRQKGISRTVFECVEDSWRAKLDPPAAAIPLGTLLAYVSEAPTPLAESAMPSPQEEAPRLTVREYTHRQEDMFGAGQAV